MLNADVAYRYCPRCGHALELRLLKAGEPERLVCAGCDFVFYIDPKLAVGTIIADDEGRVLLVRRAIEPGYGKWVFPGGYVDRGEEVRAAAMREAREECGFDVELLRLLNVYSFAGTTPVVITYTARVIGGTLAVDDEGLEAGWFTPAEIPWDALAFRNTHVALREFLQLPPFDPES